MKAFTKTITEYKGYSLPEDTLILDVETSSFSPNEGYITEAGIIKRESENIVLTQYILEDINDEESILKELLNVIKTSNLIITMDGNNFQLTFLNGRFARYEFLVNDYQKSSESCIYLSMKQYLKILYENKSFTYDVHSFALKNGYRRKSDTQSLDLIAIFAGFIGNNKLETLKKSSTPGMSVVYLNKMLLHNEDDLLELYTSTAVLNIGLPNNEKSFELLNNEKDISSSVIPNSLISRIENKELKYFLENPKDYVYLISEDMAIHKSLAFSSNKDNIAKCTKQNCYIRKSGNFFPIEYPKFFMSLFSKDEQKKIKLFSESANVKNAFVFVSTNENNEFVADKYLSVYLHFICDYSIII